MISAFNREKHLALPILCATIGGWLFFKYYASKPMLTLEYDALNRAEFNKEQLREAVNKYTGEVGGLDSKIIKAINRRLDEPEIMSARDKQQSQLFCPSKPTNILFDAFGYAELPTKIRNKLCISKSDPHGYPLIDYIVRYGSFDLIEHLIKCGIRFDLVQTLANNVPFYHVKDGVTRILSVALILHSAVMNYDSRVIKLLCTYYPKLVTSKPKFKPFDPYLRLAIGTAYVGALEALCENGTKIEDSDFENAAHERNILALDCLFKHARYKGIASKKDALESLFESAVTNTTIERFINNPDCAQVLDSERTTFRQLVEKEREDFIKEQELQNTIKLHNNFASEWQGFVSL